MSSDPPPPTLESSKDSLGTAATIIAEPDASEDAAAETKPAAKAKPAETKPAEAKPAEAKPAEAKPAEAKPAETEPAKAKPAEAKPTETKPAETKPAAKAKPTCKACSAPLEPGAMFCKRCGAPQPGAPSCPHCGAVADVRADTEVHYACKTCGAPRVVLHQDGVTLSGAEREHTKKAVAARRGRLGYWVGGAASILGALGGLGTSVVLLLVFGLIAGGLGLVATLPFVLLAIAAFKRAGAKTKQVGNAVDAAWASAARDITAQSDHPITATELSKALKLPEATTERLLARLTVDDLLDSDISPEGRLTFEPALRIETPNVATDQQAELEQAAEEQAAAKPQQRARRS